MAINRTEEYNKLAPGGHGPPIEEPIKEESVLRQRLSKVMGAIFSDNTDEDICQLSSELLSTSRSILLSIDETAEADNMAPNIRRHIESLEGDISKTEEILGEQLRDHHNLIVLYLKQRLSKRERNRIIANQNIGKYRALNRKGNASIAESKVVMMTEDDLAKKYQLSDTQLQVLQESTQELLSQHTAFAKELGVVGDHLTEIARLQQTLSEQLEWQAALGERLLDEADSTMGTVQKGNKILEKVSSDSTMRNLVVFVFLILSLLLILFALIN